MAKTLQEKNFEDLTTCGEQQVFLEECNECDDCTSRGLDAIVEALNEVKQSMINNYNYLKQLIIDAQAKIQHFQQNFDDLWIYVAKLKPGIPRGGVMVNWSSVEPNMGQVLEKTSHYDFDAGWYTLPCPFPVNSIFMTTDDINPSNYWNNTEWERFSEGKTIFGYSRNDIDFSAGKSGGSKVLKLVSHSHSFSPARVVVDVPWYNGATKVGAKASRLTNHGTKENTVVGSSGTVNSNNNDNLPPYITTYIWKRIA